MRSGKAAPKAKTPAPKAKAKTGGGSSVRTRTSIVSKPKPKAKTPESDKTSFSNEIKSKEPEKKSAVNLDAWGMDLSGEARAKNAEEAKQDGDASKNPEAKTSDQAKAEADTAKATADAEASNKARAELEASLGEKTLRKGGSGDSVRSLQTALSDKLGKDVEADGKFGPKTREAVIEFQRKHGLTPDGVVGPKTRAKLLGEKVEVPGSDTSAENKAKNPDAKAENTEGVKLPENVPVPKPRPEQAGKKAEEADKSTANTQAGDGKLSFGKKLNDTQKKAINGMVADLKAKGFDVKPNDIINFMAAETGGTFSTGRSKNGAVGLAQFTSIAVKDMNRFRGKNNKLSKSKLANMNFTDQSKVVTEYLGHALGRKNMQGKNVSAADLYTAVFAPVAVGKSMDASIYSNSGKTKRFYRANRSLDANRDGKITKGELSARLDKWTKIGAEQLG